MIKMSKGVGAGDRDYSTGHYLLDSVSSAINAKHVHVQKTTGSYLILLLPAPAVKEDI